MIKTGNSSTLRKHFATTVWGAATKTTAQLISLCLMAKILYPLYQSDKKFIDL